MGSTNKTTNLNLSQFVDNDKPSWRGDYNGDMNKISAGYKALSDDLLAQNTNILLAQNMANAADSKATSANANADSAVTTSNAANIKADDALTNANIADGKATNAVTTANTANTKADTAISNASTANTTANNAVTVANAANTKATTADNKAVAADTKATNANSSVSALQDRVSVLESGAGSDTGWIEVTTGLAPGVSNTPTNKISYRIKNGIVYWRGAFTINSTTNGWNAVLTSLPSLTIPTLTGILSFAPSGPTTLVAQGGAYAGGNTMDVYTNGTGSNAFTIGGCYPLG